MRVKIIAPRKGTPVFLMASELGCATGEAVLAPLSLMADEGAVVIVKGGL